MRHISVRTLKAYVLYIRKPWEEHVTRKGYYLQKDVF